MKSAVAIEPGAPVETVFAVSAASGSRGAMGTVYFSFCHWDAVPLMVIDWDLQPLAQALPTYLPGVTKCLADLRAGYKVVLYPQDSVLYAEPEGLGKVVMLEAYKSVHDVREIREDIATLDLEERATPAMVFLHAGQVKFTPAAFQKTLNFAGTSRNHLHTQIDKYAVGQKADQAELLTAWCTGILLALETGR